MFPEEDEPHQHDDDGKQEHKNGYPVDPVHIAYPAILRFAGIFFLNIQIFSYLPPDAHNVDFISNIQNSPGSRLLKTGADLLDLSRFVLKNDSIFAKSYIFALQNGGLAQLARAFAWHAKGHRFDSGNLHKAKTSVFSLFFPIILHGKAMYTRRNYCYSDSVGVLPNFFLKEREK